MNVMSDKIMQKGENNDSVRYYDVIIWSCIMFVKGEIILLLEDNSTSLSIVHLITD